MRYDWSLFPLRPSGKIGRVVIPFALPLLAVAFLLGLFVRGWAIFDDFWFDEIWSWKLVGGVHSVFGVFFGIRHDNSHPINSLFMYFIGDCRRWFVYRLLSLTTGIGAMVMAALVPARKNRSEPVFAFLIVAGSFIFVTYSSEARGYQPMVFFALLSFHALDRGLEDGRKTWNTIFGLGAILGFLSHFSFLHFYAAALLWSGWNILSRQCDWRARFVAFANRHCVPVAFITLYYFTAVRGMTIGGTNEETVQSVASSALALIWGLPAGEIAGALALAWSLVVFALELNSLRREKSDLWIFYLGAILIFPAAFMVLFPPWALFPRYFLVSVTFFSLLAARFLARCFNHGVAGKIFALALMTLILTGNGTRILRYLRVGKGHYLEAVRYLAENTKGSQIMLGSNQDLRSTIPLEFYSRYLPSGKKFIYLPVSDWPKQSPEWYLFHRQDETPVPDPKIGLSYRYHFDRVRIFPYYGLSGFEWILYHRSSEDRFIPPSSSDPVSVSSPAK